MDGLTQLAQFSENALVVKNQGTVMVRLGDEEARRALLLYLSYEQP